jgi:hypothetical protein
MFAGSGVSQREEPRASSDCARQSSCLKVRCMESYHYQTETPLATITPILDISCNERRYLPSHTHTSRDHHIDQSDHHPPERLNRRRQLHRLRHHITSIAMGSPFSISTPSTHQTHPLQPPTNPPFRRRRLRRHGRQRLRRHRLRPAPRPPSPHCQQQLP